MFDKKVIRLIIYLVISIAVIILLWNLPGKEQNEKKNPETKNIYEPFEIKLPEINNKDKNPVYSVEIDSLGDYICEGEIIRINELEEELTVQIQSKPKLFLKVNVHPKSNAQKLIDLVKLSEKLKMKIRFRLN